MKNIFKLKSLDFSENWRKIRFYSFGKVVNIGAAINVRNEEFLVKPMIDIIGGYSIIYRGEIFYFKNAWELKKEFRWHWLKFNKDIADQITQDMTNRTLKELGIMKQIKDTLKR